MGFTEAMQSAFNKKFDFAGRASRSEYWYFALGMLPLYIVVDVILAAVHNVSSILEGLFGLVVLVGYIFLTIVSLSLWLRRLHDTNHSGWWWLIGFIPIVGGVVLFIFTVLPSDPGDNNYGAL